MTEVDAMLTLLQTELAKRGYAIPPRTLVEAAQSAAQAYRERELGLPVDVVADEVVIDVRDRG